VRWRNRRLDGITTVAACTEQKNLFYALFILAEGGMPKASERSKHKTGKRPEGQLPLTLDVFQRVRPTILA
jgi:hypothetical protein